jgi:hypothetical protein
VGLAQLIRFLFLLVELICSGSNYRFDMSVVFTTNYSFSETFLVTDFVNLKIKLAQSFRCVHIDRVCVYIIIGVSTYTYMSICVYTVFLKKTRLDGEITENLEARRVFCCLVVFCCDWFLSEESAGIPALKM